MIAVGSLQIFLYVPLLLFISVCFHHEAFHEMFQYPLRELESLDKDRNNVLLLRDLMQFHVAAKKCVHNIFQVEWIE